MKNLSSNEYILSLILLLIASTIICAFGWYNERNKKVFYDNSKDINLLKRYDSIKIENKILLRDINHKDSIVSERNKKIEKLNKLKENNDKVYKLKKIKTKNLNHIGVFNTVDSILRSKGIR